MKKIFYYIFLSLVLIGCNNDDMLLENSKSTAKLQKVTLQFSVPGLTEKVINTKAVDESVISTMDIIVVNKNDNKVFQHIQLDNPSITWNGTLGSLSLNLNGISSCNIYMYANLGSLRSQISLNTALPALITNDVLATAPNIKMGGELLNTSIPFATGADKKFTLYRNVAKILIQKAECKDCPSETVTYFDPKLDLTSAEIYLKNATSRGSVTTNTNTFDPQSNTDGNYNSSFGKFNLSETFYTYELPHDKGFFILKAQYNGKPTFYKIALIDQSVDKDGKPTHIRYDLKRNHSYTINIRKIDGPGYDSEALAIAYPASNIIYTIEDRVNESLDMVTNGQYELGVTDVIRIKANGDIINEGIILLNSIAGELPDEEKDGKTLLKPEIISKDGNNNCDWLTEFSIKDSDTPINDTQRKYGLKIKAATNTTGAEQICTIRVKAGNLERTIKVIQEAPSTEPEHPKDKNKGKVKISDNETDTFVDYWDWLNKNVDGIYPGQISERRDLGLHFLWAYDNTSPIGGTQLRYRIEYYDMPPEAKGEYIDPSGKIGVEYVGAGSAKPFFQFNLGGGEIDPFVTEVNFTIKHSTTGEVYVDDKFTIYRTGVLSIKDLGKENRKDGVGTEISPKKYLYYEVVKIEDPNSLFNKKVYWLDRNLGATSNGFYSTATADHTDHDKTSIGWYMKIRNYNEKLKPWDQSPYANTICPSRFKVPDKDELEYLAKNLEMVPEQSKYGDTYYIPKFTKLETKNIPDVYLPTTGYYNYNNTYNNLGGYYWSASHKPVYDNGNEADWGWGLYPIEERYWQMALTIFNSGVTLPYMMYPYRINSGVNGTNSDPYAFMPIRCIFER